jgi:transcriptional regulator with XRE-family HTH domain
LSKRKRPSNYIKFAALWLLSQGRTQEHVAKKFGVGQQSVARWKQSEDKIRNAVDCDLIEHLEKVLLGEKEWRS